MPLMDVQTPPPPPPPSIIIDLPRGAEASLPSIFSHPASTPPTLVTQGAEALLYRSTYLLPSLPCALKYRPPKPYRHPILDLRLTKHRILSEARVLVKCRREGVPVPAVYAMDEAKGWLMIEWIEGDVVRIKVNECLYATKHEAVAGLQHRNAQLAGLLRRIGSAVARMHAAGFIHGDLTTSNLMLRPWANDHVQRGPASGRAGDDILDGEVVIIDFGLASQSSADEDRAVDLYVLERAFGSTHPRAEGHFQEVLDTYGKSYRGAQVVLKRLEDVRTRGRKRSMLG